MEFALVTPLLFLLVFGIVDFGRAYQAKVQLTHAVREGARTYALTQNSAAAAASAQAAAPSLNDAATPGPDVQINATLCDSTADFGDEATVSAQYAFTYLTPLPGIVSALPGGGAFDNPVILEATGVHRCGG